DKLPSEFVYEAGSLRVTNAAGTTAAASDDNVKDNTVTLSNLGTLKGGQSLTVSFKVKVSETAKGKINNVALVEGNEPGKPDPTDPTKPVEPGKPVEPKEPEVPVTVPDNPKAGRLDATKSVFDAKGTNIDDKVVQPGDVIEYRVTVRNPLAADTQVDNVKVTDKLPSEFVYEAGSLRVTNAAGTTAAASDDNVKDNTVTLSNLG
ncbi:DUF11 domain-containing protein, partial [Acinetobacter baumannii]|uniref:DUF11 domain-containing protein n=1 Tax=Acinetobacter baumannii TaxID=470 RepID=UPI001AEC98E2